MSRPGGGASPRDAKCAGACGGRGVCGGGGRLSGCWCAVAAAARARGSGARRAGPPQKPSSAQRRRRAHEPLLNRRTLPAGPCQITRPSAMHMMSSNSATTSGSGCSSDTSIVQSSSRALRRRDATISSVAALSRPAVAV